MGKKNRPRRSHICLFCHVPHTVAVKALVERKMRDDDETTAVQLHALLLCHDHTMTQKTVLRCRAALESTFRGSAYCQLVCMWDMARQTIMAAAESDFYLCVLACIMYRFCWIGLRYRPNKRQINYL